MLSSSHSGKKRARKKHLLQPETAPQEIPKVKWNLSFFDAFFEHSCMRKERRLRATQDSAEKVCSPFP